MNGEEKLQAITNIINTRPTTIASTSEYLAIIQNIILIQGLTYRQIDEWIAEKEKVQKSFQATVNDLRLTNLKSLRENGLN